MKALKIQITYDGKAYDFDSGTESYLFYIGVLNDMDEKYGIPTLLDYIELVNSCYLKDSNDTPLGKLADYIAENWESVKDKSRYDILNEFYFNL